MLFIVERISPRHICLYLKAPVLRPHRSRLPSTKAFYSKLGSNGKWESECLSKGLMRIGWTSTRLADIRAQDWSALKIQLSKQQATQGSRTRDLNALRQIVASTEEDVWIAFHGSRLWWCRLAAGLVEQDAISKFRRTQTGWSDKDIDGRVLLAAEIPGVLSQLQGFRSTCCSVRSIDSLRRLLNGEPSAAYQSITQSRDALVREVQLALTELHWKDFETLVDLLFRQAGWRRLSLLGEAMKYADLELQEPVTGERYQVQIESAADLADFAQYRDQFLGRGFRKLFFVVHTPSTRLAQEGGTDAVELVLPERLARMIVDAGLVEWMLAKIR